MAKPVNHVFPGKPVDPVAKVKAALAALPEWVVLVERRMAALEANGNGERG